jgi:hypothetical protein
VTDFFMDRVFACKPAKFKISGKTSVRIGDSSSAGFALLFNQPLERLRVLVVWINLKRFRGRRFS